MTPEQRVRLAVAGMKGDARACERLDLDVRDVGAIKRLLATMKQALSELTQDERQTLREEMERESEAPESSRPGDVGEVSTVRAMTLGRHDKPDP